DGDEALTFVRERKQFKDGDFQRARNQQAFIRGLTNEIISADTLSNPAKIQDMVENFAPYMYVDSGLDAQYISSTAFDVRHVRPSHIEFFTAPVAGVGTSPDGQYIVHVDEDEVNNVHEPVKDDTVDHYVHQHPAAHLCAPRQNAGPHRLRPVRGRSHSQDFAEAASALESDAVDCVGLAPFAAVVDRLGGQAERHRLAGHGVHIVDVGRAGGPLRAHAIPMGDVVIAVGIELVDDPG